MTARQEAGRAQTELTFALGDVRACARRLARIDRDLYPGAYATAKAALDAARANLAKRRRTT